MKVLAKRKCLPKDCKSEIEKDKELNPQTESDNNAMVRSTMF
jgi:hypothetical protein